MKQNLVYQGTNPALDPYCWGRAELDLAWVRALGRRSATCWPPKWCNTKEMRRVWREGWDAAQHEKG